ncbi:N-6 DNA methylase [Paenibacillus sp. EKM102P]|uniref:N-6 DNA methylase n=1 Tax=unclassified Paenibacillus TaxID=185978 RepID=UPI00142D8002|nr:MULTISPECIES: N-6 DNA methylase [unclassified Paenibacillus]KAF6620463.1 N-6 DNA methylase [Paenibacillus sp. EKM101P]KAF6623455.1 N-6 DNA methylase [Paenibacillus sp. EKM102P]KAF6633983.1 N-6 DNA methylase [Paenibacillus sp. EKM10P]KAF6649509.1 N-6 DNA methylase [Paenibacillus sp. EKM11P]
MWYGDKREAKVNIAMALVNKGWKIYGWKDDESDAMTDYFSPADWDGIAEKNGYVLCIDQNNTRYSGYEQKEYISGHSQYKTNARIQKLEAMMNDTASTENEKASCAVLIEKEREKDASFEKWRVTEVYPEFSFGNPRGTTWHIEKDGQIIAKGKGVFSVNDYDWENKEKTEKQQKAEKVEALVKRFEKAIKDAGALKAEVIKVEKKVIKPVEKEDKTINVNDVLSFSYHGHFWVVTDIYTNSKKQSCVTYELLGSEKRGYQRLNGMSVKRYYQTSERLNKGIEEGTVKVHTLQEVIEYQEKTVFKKTSRKQTVSNVPAIETTEDTQEETNEITNEITNVSTEVTVTYNNEKQGIEIRFPSKPESNIIEQLKAYGFRWSKRGFWYAKQSDKTNQFASSLQADYNNHNNTEFNETVSIAVFEDINIDDLHMYIVSDELQSRLHSSSLFQVDYKKDCFNTFNELQKAALNVLSQADNEYLQYQIKKYLQSFKQRYYKQYIKILNHRVNNPSWAVTGRGGLNVQRYNKMQDRYGNMLSQLSDMKKEFDNRMDKFKTRILKLEKERLAKEVNEVVEIPKFKIDRKQITLAGYTETTRVYTYKNYMIAKTWGMYRVFKDGKEVDTNLKTTSRLDEAKRFVAYLISKDEPTRTNENNDKRRILQEESENKNSNQQQYISKINKQIVSAQKKLNALSGDHLTNTWKRQQEAASREQKKDNLNLEISILEHLKEKATNNIMDEFEMALLVGSFREDMRIKYKSRGKHNYEVKYPTINPDADVNGWWNQEVPKLQKRLNKAGIHNTEQYNEAIDKYAALVKVTERPVNPVQQKIKKMESEVKLCKIDGYFPTPKTIVERMIELVDIQDGETILEPSAGNGNILDGVNEYIQDNNLNAELHGIEWNHTLRQILELKQYKLVANDFIEFTPFTKYNKIIMNPPFEKSKDVDHVLKAYDCLKDGGRLIAIMSPHWTFANDTKSIQFRNWLNDKGYYEKLPEGSFKESGTGVNTVLVVIEKVEEERVRVN